MAQSVGSLNVELSADASKLKQGVAQAVKTIDQLGEKFDEVGRDATAGMAKAERAVTKVAQETKQSLSKVEQAYQQASYGVDEFSLAYHQMAQKVARDSKKIEQASDSASRVGNKFTDMGSKMTSVGTKMSMALTAPMLLAGGQAIKTANDFDFSMQSIVAMVGLSEDKVADMGIAAREMAKEYGGSATQAADALYFVASAGIDGATAMQVLEQSLKSSAIGMGDTAIIADTVSSALNAYGIENLSAAQATDLMVAAVREGKMEADALAGALPRVLPIASAMGVSFNEVGASFAAMSRNGTDASEAATQLRGILGSLLTPTKEAEETMNGLGLSSQGLRQQIKEKGLLSTLQTLTTAFGDNDQAQGLVFGNVRALTGVMSMFGAATESTTKIFENLTDNTGDADKAFQAMSQTGAFKMKQVMAEMKDAFISLGQVLVPIVVPALKLLATAFEKVMTAINALPNFMKTIIVVLAGLVAVGGPLLIMLGSLAKAWAALKVAMAGEAFKSAIAQFAAAGPIIAGVAIAVVAVAAVWYSFSQNAKEAKERQEDLTNALADAGDEAANLTGNVTALIDEYAALKGEATDNPLGSQSGADAFVLAQLGANGLSQAILDAGLVVSEVTKTTQDGTDWFGKYANELDTATDAATRNEYKQADMLVQLEMIGKTGNVVADSLMAQYEAGKLNGAQLIKSFEALDNVADAFDDNREKLEENAKAMLTNTETVAGLSNILGTEYLNNLIASSIAEAEAAGITDVYAYALEKVRLAADEVLQGMRPMTDSLIAEATAATQATSGLAQLDNIMNLLRLSNEDGKISIGAVADQLKNLSQVAENELQMALINAQEASVKLTDGFADLGDGGRGVEMVVRKQMSEMVKLIGTVTSLGGSATDVVPTLVGMYNNMLDGADAAGINRQEILNLIDQIGILDGLSPEIVAYFTMDVSEVKAQIANVLRQFGGVQAGGWMEETLKKRLVFLNDVLTALETKPKGGKRGGGGGGSSAKNETPKDLASVVQNMVNDIADYANQLMSTDFRDALLTGSSKDIGKALQATLEEAVRLGLDKLPQFAGFIDKIKAQFARLSNMADVRDVLTTQLEDATKALEDFKSTLEEAQIAAGKFDATITGSTAPSNTLLDQALEAQKKYDELFAKSESLKQQQSDLAKSVSDSVMQPITAKNPLGNARKMLAEASKFRDNLTSLRDAGFGSDIIAQVAQAGVLEGNKIAKSLLSMSAGDIAELLSVRSQISAIATESGALVGEVVFGADIAGAESALATQNTLVRQLFTDAVAQAQAQFDQQQTLVNGLESSLESVSTQMAALVTAIQVDLHDTMFTFLAGFQGGIDKLTTPIAASAYSNFTAGQQTNLADGALANGGAIVGGIYLPPGIDFSGFHSQGGIAMKPSIGVIGESGPEAIIPLSQLNNYGGGGDTYVTVNVNGTVTSERNLVEAVRVGLLKIQKSGRTTTI